MSEILDDPITKRTEPEINESVGNDSRKQERAGTRNDKSYNQLDEKSDYDIYNPALIESISFSIPTYNLKVGAFYPITVSVNTGNGQNPIANVPSDTVIYQSSDITKAYVKDGYLYAVGQGNVEITGIIYAKDSEGKTKSYQNNIPGVGGSNTLTIE
jgi:uncharacterized protein YjdB